MYLAEIHGKLSRRNENMEDILTSNVFSFFKYAPRQVFLLALLRELGLGVSPDEAQSAEFHFWPTHPNGTEPDLVIIVGKYYLLFEAKYRSGFSERQLQREIETGAQEAASQGKVFKIIAVTAHYSHDQEILASVPEELRRDLLWINWQRIALVIYEAIERRPNLPSETLSFAADLYRLLLKKNLRYYEGPRVLRAVSALASPGEAIFFNASTAVYRGDFIGFAEALEDVAAIAPLPRQIFYSPESGFFDSLRKMSPRLNQAPAKIFIGGS